jgi:hypothetical protein
VTQEELSFDLAEGERLRDAGIAQAQDAFSRRNLIIAARQIALRIASERGCVTADDVYAEMEKQNLDPELLGNAAGSLFRGKEFVFFGEWKKSSRVSNHARMNRVWHLVGRDE